MTAANRLFTDVLSSLSQVRGPDHQGWRTALCPFHDDHDPSLRFTDTGFRCMSCGKTGNIRDIAEALGVRTAGLTLAEYATVKALPETFLKELGIKEWQRGLRIPYMDESGEEIAVRFRHSLSGPRRFSWRKGAKPVPYGLWRLKQVRERGYIILVEGESDAQTLWHTGFQALGIPGSSAWKPEWASYLDGIRKVYLAMDLDEAGKGMAERIRGDLGDRLLAFDCAPAKDVSELYLSDPDNFAKVLEEALSRASPFSAAASVPAETAREAMQFLQHPDLLDRIKADLMVIGLVGESKAGLLQYLVATSRKAPRPLGSAVRSPSSYGKTTLTTMVRELMPPEDVIEANRLTPQALQYWGEGGLKRKWLIISDVGTSDSMGSARILFSDHGLQVYYPAKDSKGRLETISHRVEGPLAYTDISVTPLTDVQDSSRFLEIPLDGSQEQTQRVQDHERWKVTLEGLQQGRARQEVIERHQAAQQMLKEGLDVVIPYSPLIKFPSSSPRARRDLGRFLSIVQAVAFLRQTQKEVCTQENDAHYVEADLADYASAYELFMPLADSILNDLNPLSLKLLDEVRTTFGVGDTFTRQDIASKLNQKPTFVRDYIGPVVEAGYLEVTESGGRGKAWNYKLPYRTPEDIGISTPEEIEEALELATSLGEGVATGAVISSNTRSRPSSPSRKS